jgi:hypothetical protein
MIIVTEQRDNTNSYETHPPLRCDIIKEAARKNVQGKRPITSRPGPQLHHTRNTKQDSRQG